MNDYYKNLSKKYMGAGALFFNEAGELLVVKPTYKDTWEIPGGVVEENESPRQACVREIQEELGLKISNVNFLCVDYKQAMGGEPDSLQFIFSGGTLTPTTIGSIILPKEELSEYKFVTTEEAVLLLSQTLGQRIHRSIAALKHNQIIYLENGY